MNGLWGWVLFCCESRGRTHTCKLYISYRMENQWFKSVFLNFSLVDYWFEYNSSQIAFCFTVVWRWPWRVLGSRCNWCSPFDVCHMWSADGRGHLWKRRWSISSTLFPDHPLIGSSDGEHQPLLWIPAAKCCVALCTWINKSLLLIKPI